MKFGFSGLTPSRSECPSLRSSPSARPHHTPLSHPWAGSYLRLPWRWWWCVNVHSMDAMTTARWAYRPRFAWADPLRRWNSRKATLLFLSDICWRPWTRTSLNHIRIMKNEKCHYELCFSPFKFMHFDYHIIFLSRLRPFVRLRSLIRFNNAIIIGKPFANTTQCIVVFKFWPVCR